MIFNRKNIIILLIFVLFSLPVCAKNNTIEDELLKSKHFLKKVKPIQLKNNKPITDELLDTYIDNDNDGVNDLFKLNIYKQGEYSEESIGDELLSPEFIENVSKQIIVKKEIPDEYFIEKNIDTSKVRRVKAKTKYDFTKKQIAIKIKIAKHLKSTKGSLEGGTIPFIAIHDFKINGKKYKEGTEVLGRIETISSSDKMGVPECIKIDNFYINDEGQEINLHGSVSKTGANRSIWVYPLYQAGNICFYVAGFVFVPIHGGRAKLSPEETFTVFYETN